MQGSAAGGANAFVGPKVEEDAGTGSRFSLGVMGDSDAEFVIRDARHVLGGFPVGLGDLSSIDDLVVVARSGVVDGFRGRGELAIRETQPREFARIFAAKGSAQVEEPRRGTPIAFGFVGAGVWRFTLEAEAPGKAASAEQDGVRLADGVPGCVGVGALVASKGAVGRCPVRCENEEDLAAIGRDRFGEIHARCCDGGQAEGEEGKVAHPGREGNPRGRIKDGQLPSIGVILEIRGHSFNRMSFGTVARR